MQSARCRLFALLLVLLSLCSAVSSLYNDETLDGSHQTLGSSLQTLVSLLEPDHPTAPCRRKLELGGVCDCAFVDGDEVDQTNVKWDRHVSGRRSVCLDHFTPDQCNTVSLASDPQSESHVKFRQAITKFGCQQPMMVLHLADPDKFSLADVAADLKVDVLHLLDVAAPLAEHRLLEELARGKSPRMRAKQLTVHFMFDLGEATGEDVSQYDDNLVLKNAGLVKDLEAIGYRLLSVIPNPKCVKQVQDRFQVCLPIYMDVTWIADD